MEFPVKTGAAASQRTECAILPVFEDGQLRGATREMDTAARGIIKQLVRKGDVSGRLGSTTLIHRTEGTAATRWLLVGCGKHTEYNVRRLASAVTAAVTSLRHSGAREAVSYLAYGVGKDLGPALAARHSVETARAAVYRFDELKSRNDPSPRLARLSLAAPRGTNPAPLRADRKSTRLNSSH